MSRDRLIAKIRKNEDFIAITSLLDDQGYPWRLLPLTATLMLTATLVLARRPHARIARAFFFLAAANFLEIPNDVFQRKWDLLTGFEQNDVGNLFGFHEFPCE